MNIEKLKGAVRNISNFPIEGIEFKDITTLFQSVRHASRPPRCDRPACCHERRVAP